MSLLSVAVQYFAVPKIICYVSKGSFYPMPKVDSAIIRLTPRTADNQQRIANSETEKFFRVVKAGFSNKRKQLGNNLAAAFHLSKKEIDAKLLMSGVAYERRAEILTLKEWQKISNIF
jgi:16S rRNA (adenine1518-N6/adenine1519-N6)-dimethyltransferase